MTNKEGDFLISLRAPGKITWSICSEESEHISEMTDRIIKACINARIIGIKILNSDLVIRSDYFQTILSQLKEGGIGIYLSLKGSSLIQDNIDVINRYCNFIEIIISEKDCYSILKKSQLAKHVNIRLVYKVNNDNAEYLFPILAQYKPLENMFQKFLIMPDYEVRDYKDLLVREQLEQLSLDIINKSFEYEDDSKVTFIDELQDIRILLEDKLIMSHLYIDCYGNIYINEITKVLCGNIKNDNLIDIWNQVKFFWHNQSVKQFYSSILNEMDNYEKIFSYITNREDFKKIISE
jgi:hypothetical protein